MDDEYTSIQWYFEEKYSPCCSSFWQEYQCSGKPSCLFSHSPPKFKATIDILSESFMDPVELYFYISNYAAVNLQIPEGFETIPLSESSHIENNPQ